MIEIPYLKDFFDAVKRTSIDDYVDRLNYYWTTVILIFFAVLTGAKQILGKPIDCMMPAEYPGSWNEYVREYCYVSSTYFKHPEDIPVGVGIDEVAVQGYYQWVPFIIFLQAIFMYLPHLAWLFFQSTRDLDMSHLVSMAQDIRFASIDDREKKLQELVSYVKQRLSYRGTTYGVSYVGFGMKSSLLYLVSKALTILVLILQLAFMNYCFGQNRNTYWGLTMFVKSLTSLEWRQEQENGVFPRVTFCNFSQPILGNKYPKRTVQCVLMVNMFNEKIFVFAWCWFAAMLIISIINFFYTAYLVFVPQVRYNAASFYLKPLSPDSSSDSCINFEDDEKISKFADHTLGPDGIQLFYFIERHCGSFTASEISCALFSTYYNDDSDKPPLLRNKIHTLGEKQGVSHC